MITVSLLAALEWATFVWWISVILKVAVGLGAVIFVHELGHYLVALACGVKIEKFMIGFDIGGVKLSRRWGDTEYGIGIVPLGGYVKFLGQDDDPAHLAEQMQKSQIAANSPNAKAITGPSGETYYVDRRSYLAKSVPQRMAIISAGVVMNIIFAFIFAVIAYGMGVPYMPSIVSETVPGSPAWQAGLEPGDEIVWLAGRENPNFMQLRGGVTLGDLEEGISCIVRRAATGEEVPIVLKPTREAGRLATIGVGGPQSLTLRKGMPTIEGSPAARAKLVSAQPPTTAPDSDKVASKLQGGDTLVRVGDTAVADYRALSAELSRSPSESLLITVERKVSKKPKKAERGAPRTDQPQELTFEVQPQTLTSLPLVMKMGPIAAVQSDSPADRAGILEGDRIVAVDGEPISRAGQPLTDSQDAAEGAPAEWADPVKLPSYLRQAAVDGRDVELTLRRTSGKEVANINVRLTPIEPTAFHSDIPLGAPLPADSLGIAFEIHNEVQSIAAVNAEAKLDVAPGDRIESAKILLPATKETTSPEPITIKLGAENANWPALISALQDAPVGAKVELTVGRGEEAKTHTVTLAPQTVEGFYVPPRGFLFEPIVRTRQAASFAQQLRYGWDETAESLTMVFRFLQKLGTQVPVTALGGPVTIARAAGYSAAEGISSLLIFLTMLSANLAVINFLPIPVLDGGHMVFLAYEGIRGRPASERFVIAMHTAGFVFIVGLMLFVLALDFGIVPRNL